MNQIYTVHKTFLDGALKGMTITEIRKKIENQIKGQVMVDGEVRAKIYIHPQEVTERFNASAEKYQSKARVFIGTIFVKSAFGKDAARQKIDARGAGRAAGLVLALWWHCAMPGARVGLPAGPEDRAGALRKAENGNAVRAPRRPIPQLSLQL